MTLIEAVKTGKKFRRKEEGRYSIYEDLPEGRYIGFMREDILADDWEVEAPEPEKITVTAEQVNRALERVFNAPPDRLPIQEWCVLLLKELGFKEI